MGVCVGDRLEHLLVKADPGGDTLCDRPECLFCATTEKDKGKCRMTNLVYKVECKICAKEGSRAQYWGETARSGFERSSEHREDLSKQRGGHMEKHIAEKHPDIDLRDPKNRIAEDNFTIKAHKKYKTAMDRQLAEAICIARNGGMDSEMIVKFHSRDTR